MFMHNLHKLFILCVKYLPVIQMAGMLLNNTLYYFKPYTICYIIDYLLGLSIANCVILFIASFIFNFCKWHRLIITANIINITIANYDAIYKINCSDKELLILYYIIAGIFILLSTKIHLIRKDNEHKIKDNKETS